MRRESPDPNSPGHGVGKFIDLVDDESTLELTGDVITSPARHRSAATSRKVAVAAAVAGAIATTGTAAIAAAPAQAATKHDFCSWSGGSAILKNPYGTAGGPYTCLRDQNGYFDVTSLHTNNWASTAPNKNHSVATSGVCLGVTDNTDLFRHYSSTPADLGHACWGASQGVRVLTINGYDAGYPYVHDDGNGGLSEYYRSDWFYYK